MKVILPRTFVDPQDITVPFFFLAGPVEGGDDWQADFCRRLELRLPDCLVAVPCFFWRHRPKLPFQSAYGREDEFKGTQEWEYYYLALAAERSKTRQGAIVFWLPMESETNPRRSGDYARDTRGELGAWRVRYALDRSIHLVIGAHSLFPGLKVIKENFRLDLGGKEEFPFCCSLDETVEQTARWVEGK